MKTHLPSVALVILLLVVGCVVSSAVYLNKPLTPGQGMRGSGYQFQFSRWHDWHFGTSQVNMYIMPIGHGPCICKPYARVIELGPVSITH